MALYIRTEKFWNRVRDQVQAKLEIQGINRLTQLALEAYVYDDDWLDHLLEVAPESRDLTAAEVATVIVRNWFARNL